MGNQSVLLCLSAAGRLSALERVRSERFHCSTNIEISIFRTRSIGMRMCELAIFSNAEKFRCLYSYYGSCMPSFPKEY